HPHEAVSALESLFVTLSRVVLIINTQHAVLPHHRFHGPYCHPLFFPHRSQPLFSLLLMFGFSSDSLDTATLTSPLQLAKFPLPLVTCKRCPLEARICECTVIRARSPSF